MTTTSSSTSYLSVYAQDPASTATTFATQYTSGAKALLATQTTSATATATGLTNLETALTTFQTAIAGLASVGSTGTSVLAQTATFSDTSYGTAKAGASAVPGSYSFFVQQIATASQMTYGGLTSISADNPGTLTINQTGLGNSFSVDLSKADTDGDGTLSPQEIATAINSASGNGGEVTASVITINGQAQLALTSDTTGADSTVSLDASGITDPTLQSELTDSSNITQTGTPQDAIIWLGDQTTGTEIQQASNTFTNVGGVSMTFTKAMTTGTTPITLTVATDNTTTATNLQSFVTAYNALVGVLATALALPGDGTSAGAATTSSTATSTSSTSSTATATTYSGIGTFADDAGISLLRSKLVSLVTQVTGGVSLANYGVTNQVDGTLSLNTTQLNTMLAANPNGLATLMGNASGVGSGTGVLGSLDIYAETWSNVSNGTIAERQAAVTKTQADLATQTTDLNNTYNDVYQRYLTQFTALQTLETTMNSNTNLFDALFSSSSS